MVAWPQNQLAARQNAMQVALGLTLTASRQQEEYAVLILDTLGLGVKMVMELNKLK